LKKLFFSSLSRAHDVVWDLSPPTLPASLGKILSGSILSPRMHFVSSDVVSDVSRCVLREWLAELWVVWSGVPASVRKQPGFLLSRLFGAEL